LQKGSDYNAKEENHEKEHGMLWNGGILLGEPVLRGIAWPQDQKPIELTFNHFVPSVGVMGDQYKKWGEMLEKRSNGRLKIKWFWSDSLFSMKEVLPSVAAGVADFGVGSGAYFPNQLPTIMTLEHAYNASDLWAGTRAQTHCSKILIWNWNLKKRIKQAALMPAASSVL
jgi:TRAP-type C4-dicarboxylate transport system substrate-binding protein